MTSAQGSVTSAGAVLTIKAPDGGDRDESFSSQISGDCGPVYAIAVQPDGKVVFGGCFTSVNGVTRNGIARVNRDGSLDKEFEAGVSGFDLHVDALLLQPDGKVLIGGTFTNVNDLPRHAVARLNPDGFLDRSFMEGQSGTSAETYPEGTVFALALQRDGKVLVGGGFTNLNGLARSRIARLNEDGELDSTFQDGLVGADSSVLSIAVQSDGKVVIGGQFSAVNGVTRAGVARLNPDGTLDDTFLWPITAGRLRPVYWLS